MLLILRFEEAVEKNNIFIFKDFRSYAEAQKRVEEAYRDEARWAKMAMSQTARVGKFSSDRTIEDYVRDIWHLTKITVDAEA